MRQEQAIAPELPTAVDAPAENYLPSYLNWAVVGLGWCVFTMTNLDAWFVLEGLGYFVGGLLLVSRRNTAAPHRLVVLGAATGFIGTVRLMARNDEVSFSLALWVMVELFILGRHLLAFDRARRFWSSAVGGTAPDPSDAGGSRSFAVLTSEAGGYALWVAILGVLWCLIDLAVGIGGMALGGYLQGVFQTQDNLFTYVLPGWSYEFAIDAAFVVSAIATRRGSTRGRRVFLILAGAEAWGWVMAVVGSHDFSVMAILSAIFWTYGFFVLAPRGRAMV